MRARARRRTTKEREQGKTQGVARNVARQFYGWAARSGKDQLVSRIPDHEKAASLPECFGKLQAITPAGDRESACADRERNRARAGSGNEYHDEFEKKIRERPYD